MMLKKTLILTLCLLLVLCTPVAVFAQSENTLTISTAEEFLAFSEHCRLDSSSLGLQVKLTSDIDLTGTDFQGIPIFSGSFDGGGYTVSGVAITCAGSNLGFFRYLSESASVSNLSVTGNIQPQGSRSSIGGIAGSNAGRIENCRFDGSISGSDQVGGIVGVNTVTGTVEGCSASGQISGNHFAGGIAGENRGVLRSCVSNCAVNTTPQQNSVELSDITLDTLTTSEAAATVTDIGGIAGISSGVIRGCENRGDVGYKHMGYNVGGIAGSQTGYLTQCENYGSICGRKEVGGIVGQLEPVALIEYSADTLQQLRGQLDTLDTLTTRAAANAESSYSTLSGQLDRVQKNTESARDAVDTLLPDISVSDSRLPEVSVPDRDSALVAQSNLSSALSGIQNSLGTIGTTAENAVDTLSGDLRAIVNQVSAMGETVNAASENLGGSITDVSDSDTDSQLTGKADRCINYGAVLADLNTGGIAGAIAFENDLDPDSDVAFTGNSSLNFEGALRAVIINCENTASVTASKQNAGGIIGWQSMGLVKNSLNTGSVAIPDGKYVGGIAGRSAGFIRSCSAKCEITGSRYVGGIAGTGQTLSDCRGMAKLTATENMGGILGFAESRTDITGNFCLAAASELGGIDGISYDSCAQSLPLADFLKLEALPELFKTVTATFRFTDGTTKTVSVATGETLAETDIPQIPEKAGHIAHWEGLDLTALTFDAVYEATYTPLSTVIQSTDTRESGLPVLLLEGLFSPQSQFSLTPLTEAPAQQTDAAVVELWQLPTQLQAATVRFLPPTGCNMENLFLYLRTDNGWLEAPFTADGSYLVFTPAAGATGFCIVESTPTYTGLYIAAGLTAAAVIGGITWLFLHKRKKPPKANK